MPVKLIIFFALFSLCLVAQAQTDNQAETATKDNLDGDDNGGAKIVDTPYTEQKVVFDFYYDDPVKINSALYWVRSLMMPLIEAPYDYAPDFLSLKVVIHGTELVTLAKKNYAKYRDAVERMRYYASLGVEFKVCNLAANDYGYLPKDFYEFVHVVPSAITEIAHWQLMGYALITPQVLEKKFNTDEIR
ncbi:MAG: DsrE family protein [Gammaproteobacteria bacterium]|nr:DsrE family protein [Gammaproteobacteria bacterium]